MRAGMFAPRLGLVRSGFVRCELRNHIRHKFSVLFIDHHSVRSFMNQVSQRDVLHFVCDCLDYYSLLADVGVADAQ